MAKQQSQSLAAQSGALKPAALTLPAVFQRPQEPVKAKEWPPLVSFAHPKRLDEWAKIKAQFGDAVEGDMYLVRGARCVHLDPVAKLGLIACKQYWAESNPAGEMVRASWTEQPHPWKEFVVCVVLVYLQDEVVPANMLFKTTKCPAAKALADALEAASDDAAWGAKSEAHKHSLVFQQPFMRFYGEVKIGDPRTSRTSGLTYKTAGCRVQPTTTVEWVLLKALVEGAGTQKALDDAGESFQYRIQEVTKKVK